MGTLTITKAYSDGSALMEAHIDNFRTGLLTLVNTDLFDSGNFGTTALTNTHFSNSVLLDTDATNLEFGASADALLGLDASKNLVFDTANSGTDIWFNAGSYDLGFFAAKLNAPGDIKIGAARESLLTIVGKYIKPVLVWASSVGVTVQGNSASSNETLIVFPTFTSRVDESSPSKYRAANLTSTANGYGSSDTGAAIGGIRKTLTATANTWYYVYACKLRSGTDYSATSNKFVLVFDTTPPTTGNKNTLDGYYGGGNWVYLGTVRYGFGAAGSSISIPKFKYSNKGWCHFYEADTGYAGVNLAYNADNTDDTSTPLYTLAQGNSGNVAPNTCSHVSLHLSRVYVSDWYIKDTDTNIIFRGGWQNDEGTLPSGFVVELPMVAYTVHQERINAGTVNKFVTLTGFCDKYLPTRRQGHGI